MRMVWQVFLIAFKQLLGFHKRIGKIPIYNQLTLSKRDYFREHEWASYNDVVEDLKNKNWFSREDGILLQDCNIENLLKLPAFQTIVQFGDSRLQF